MSQDNISTIVVKIDNPCISSFIIKTGLQGPIGPFGAILDASDLDTSELEDGAVIMFNSELNKFKTTRLLENQIINAGQY